MIGKKMSIIIFALLCLALVPCCVNGLAEGERHVWAPQGETAFFSENGKIGLQTATGEVLLEAMFTEVSLFNAKKEAVVRIGNKTGCINRQGDIIFEPIVCDHVTFTENYTDDGEMIFIVERENMYGLMIPERDNRFLPLGDRYYAYDGGYYVHNEEKWFQTNTLGEPLSNERWEYCSTYGDYTIETRKMKRSLSREAERICLDLHGNIVTRYCVDDAGVMILTDAYIDNRSIDIRNWEDFAELESGYYAFKTAGLWGVIDDCENIVVEPRWKYITASDTTSPEGLWKTWDEDGILYWIDKNGNILATVGWNGMGSSKIKEDRWHGYGDGYSMILNDAGKIVKEIPAEYEVRAIEDGCFSYFNASNYTWGFMDADGEMLSSVSYHDVMWLFSISDTENGYIPVRKRNSKGETLEVGYMDIYGKTTSRPEWISIGHFYGGRAFVTLDDTFGAENFGEWNVAMINEAGEYVTDKRWGSAGDFMNRDGEWLAEVNYLFSKGYINTEGEYVLEISSSSVFSE